MIGEFVAPTGSSNTGIPNVTLTDGDILRLTFFERGGGEYNRFDVDPDGVFGPVGGDPGTNDDDRIRVGSAASGIDILPVPEPASLSLLALGGLGLLARRHRGS
jgi:hypothetical protein